MRKTSNIEAVETHNIARSLTRLRHKPSYDPQRPRRVLYHAILISGFYQNAELAAIRVAM
jgi:hypothetical protein